MSTPSNPTNRPANAPQNAAPSRTPAAPPRVPTNADAEKAIAKNKAEAKGKPGRKPGQPAREYDMTGLSASMLAAPKVVTREQASQFAPSKARSELQIAMDKVVLNYHRDWTNGVIRDYERLDANTNSPVVVGKTTPKTNKWAEMPKARYHIDPKAEDGFVALVNRAAVFHNVSVKWGQRNVHDQHGNKVMVFAVRDRNERSKDDDTEEGDANEANDKTPETSEK